MSTQTGAPRMQRRPGEGLCTRSRGPQTIPAGKDKRKPARTAAPRCARHQVGQRDLGALITPTHPTPHATEPCRLSGDP